MSLFDPNDYNLHPVLWPPAGPGVMSDDQAADLVWPGVTSTPGQRVDTPGLWGPIEEGPESWK